MGVINQDAKTIAVTVPSSSDLSSLTATFSTSGLSVSIGDVAQVSGQGSNNFSSPVIYTVHAADGTTADYTVTVTLAAASASGVTITYPVDGGPVCSPFFVQADAPTGSSFVISLYAGTGLVQMCNGNGSPTDTQHTFTCAYQLPPPVGTAMTLSVKQGSLQGPGPSQTINVVQGTTSSFTLTATGQTSGLTSGSTGYLQVFDDAGHTHQPLQQQVFSAPSGALDDVQHQMTVSLPSGGTFYFFGWRDSNSDGVYGATTEPSAAATVVVPAGASGVTISIQNPATL